MSRGHEFKLKINMSGQNEVPLFQTQRRSKFIAFIISEVAAVGLLLGSGVFALCWRVADPTVTLSVNILTIAAAAAVAIIPIIFFALAPTLPRGER